MMNNEKLAKMVWNLVDYAKARSNEVALACLKESDPEAVRMMEDTLSDSASVIVTNAKLMIGREIYRAAK